MNCGWEGTVARPSTLSAGARSAALLRSPQAKWIAVGLMAVMVGVTAVRLQRGAGVDRTPPQACNIGTAPRYVPSGQSYDGIELRHKGLQAPDEGDALTIRSGCAWGVPGRNPYKGSVRQALVAAKLPKEVVHKIEAMVDRGEVTDRVEIRRNSIQTRSGKRHFDTKIAAMGFGKTLCFGTHVNFEPGHVEIADLYDAADESGTIFSVMVPYVCNNVSVLAERAERPETPVADTGVWVSPRGATPGPRPQGVPGIGDVAQSTPGVGPSTFSVPGGGGSGGGGEEGGGGEGGGGGGGGGGEEPCEPTPSPQVVPEPGTIAAILAALAALAISNAVSRRRGRRIEP